MFICITSLSVSRALLDFCYAEQTGNLLLYFNLCKDSKFNTHAQWNHRQLHKFLFASRAIQYYSCFLITHTSFWELSRYVY